MKKGSNLAIALVCIVLIVIIIALSASPIGWKIEKKAVDSINLKDVVVLRNEGEAGYGLPGIPVYTITVTNTFIPRQYELPYVMSCLYNSNLRTNSYISTQWDTQPQVSEFGQGSNTLEVIRGTKTATLKLMPEIRYKPNQPVPVKQVQQNETYDQLLLFFQEAGGRTKYIDCFNLQDADLESAIKIAVTK